MNSDSCANSKSSTSAAMARLSSHRTSCMWYSTLNMLSCGGGVRCGDSFSSKIHACPRV